MTPGRAGGGGPPRGARRCQVDLLAIAAAVMTAAESSTAPVAWPVPIESRSLPGAQVVTGHRAAVADLAFTANGDTLWTASHDGTAVLHALGHGGGDVLQTVGPTAADGSLGTPERLERVALLRSRAAVRIPGAGSRK